MDKVDAYLEGLFDAVSKKTVKDFTPDTLIVYESKKGQWGNEDRDTWVDEKCVKIVINKNVLSFLSDYAVTVEYYSHILEEDTISSDTNTLTIEWTYSFSKKSWSRTSEHEVYTEHGYTQSKDGRYFTDPLKSLPEYLDQKCEEAIMKCVNKINDLRQ